MKKETLLIVIIPVLIALFGFGAWLIMKTPRTEKFSADVIKSLSADNPSEAFKKVSEIPNLVFPDDLGPHPEYQTEWWYYTGNLVTAGGRRFGYQLTFFRRALSITRPRGDSKWRASQMYFAHFALSDVAENQFYSFERFSRASLGLAGATASPYQVWVESWRVSQTGETVTLRAGRNNIEIELALTPTKPIVLQGDRGYSQKGREKGNASVYFSMTRIATDGVIRIDSEVFNVTGSSWMDKEWSTSALEPEYEGWDWFSLQLDTNQELMLYQLRSKYGGVSPFSSGSYVAPNGDKITLDHDQYVITPVETWKSPHSGAVYPARWIVEIPSLDLKFDIIPLMSDQEHQHSFQYWEGAIKIESDDVGGFGYVELTGYE